MSAIRTGIPKGRTLAPDDLEYLGDAGGWKFFRYPKGPDGSEYIAQHVAMTPDEVSKPARRDELRIASPRTRDDLGTVTEYVAVVKAERVATGSYAATLEREARTARIMGPKSHRPVDLVRRLPLLRARPDYVIPTPGADRLALPGGPVAGFAAGAPPITGAAAIVARLESRGVRLELTRGGRLLVTSPGGNLGDDVLAVVTRCERLLVAYLSGRPIACELAHDGPAPEAVTVLAVDVPACADHAAGRESAPAPEAEAPKRSALGRFLPSASA